MKLTTTSPITISRFHKRSSKGSSYKKFLINQKSINGVKREVLRETSLRNHSDDSLLGEENNADYLYNSAIPHPSVFKFNNSQKRPTDDSFLMSSKRHRVAEDKEYDLDDSYSFPVSHVTLPNTNSVCVPSGMQTSVPPASKAIRRSLVQAKRSPTPVTLSSQLSSSSRNGKFGLQILNQPEQQHRARYQTEGSRGAVKDRTGNSFPVVKVTGYNRPTTLQVFIGSDQGRVTPHMFYQACRVTGKNSTPCVEKNVEGTIVIEIDLEPSKDMTVTCDCVGILKERNVDVEHRFPEECSTRSKKKSTRCRMVFRTVITNDDGSTETLQIASQPIACTQPPGIPEICKKSLTHCQVSGGKELFVLGKNFLKDTHVRFYTDDWEQTVTPDKEFLQQTHLVCVVPAYRSLDINEPIAAKMAVISGNRSSEPHSFTYTPVVAIASPSPTCSPLSNRLSPIITEPLDSGIIKPAASTADNTSDSDSGLSKTTENSILKTSNSSTDDCENVNPSVLLWPTSNNLSSATARNCSTYNVQNANSKMMTSPAPLLRPSAIALGRRPSIQTIVPNSMGSAPVSAAEVLSNLTSAAICSPCQSTGGIVPHYPDAASIPNYFQATDRVMADYASNPVAYRNAALSDIVDPLALKSPIVVPKLEPRSDVSFQSQAASASTEFPCGGGVIASGIKSSMTSPPAGACAMSASDLYSKSQSAYSAVAAAAGAASSDMYGGKRVAVVDNLSTFGGDGNGGNGIGADPCGVLSTGGASCSSPGSSSSSSVEASTYASLVNGGASASYAAAAAAAAVLMTPPTSDNRGYIKSEELPGMVSMAGGESAYDQMTAATDLKNKTYQLDQMFDMKSKTPEQQQRASYENLQAAGAICYKNTLMGVDQAQTNTALAIYQQNYRNFASTAGSISETSSNSSDVVEVTSKMAASQQSPIMDSMVGASAMGCVESSSSMMLDDGKLTSTGTTSPIQQQQCAKNASSSMDDCSFLNVVTQAQQHQSVNEAYVSSATNVGPVDSSNFINSVPKLEELVNNAAESHIRSANMTALAVLGADHAANERSAAAAASISLNMFLSSSSSSSSSSASTQANEAALNCNQSVVVSSGNSCGVMSNSTSSLLSPYQHLMGPVSNKMPSASDQLVQMKNIGHANNTTDKSDNNVAGLIKKPDDAVFASEINRMTENDLLSFINPSCFDQVATIASIVAEHLQT